MIGKVKSAIKAQLTQGVTPEKLAQSLAAGLLIGCFPLLGFTTALAAIFGFFFKLNHVVVQTANYMMYPVQIILIPVYIKAASLFMDVGNVSIRPDLMIEAFRSDWVGFLKTYAIIGLYAVIIWCVLSSILFLGLQKVFVPTIRRLSKLKG